MAPAVVLLVLASAILHATWNALLRSGADRLQSITLMGTVTAAIAAPFLLALPAPDVASWRYIGLSAALQVGYCLFLVRAYRGGQLGAVYPIARGTAPLFVTLGAALFAGERLSLMGGAGVVLVSAGIIALALGRDRPDAVSTLAAVVTGLFISGYMVTDGIGVRLAGHTSSYIAWGFFTQGLAMPFVYWAVRRRPPRFARDRETLKAIGGGMISLVAYGIVIWALSLGPMGKVSALRETSVIFAAVIGAVFLKEPLTLQRLGCAVLVAGGALLLAAGG